MKKGVSEASDLMKWVLAILVFVVLVVLISAWIRSARQGGEQAQACETIAKIEGGEQMIGECSDTQCGSGYTTAKLKGGCEKYCCYRPLKDAVLLEYKRSQEGSFRQFSGNVKLTKGVKYDFIMRKIEDPDLATKCRMRWYTAEKQDGGVYKPVGEALDSPTTPKMAVDVSPDIVECTKETQYWMEIEFITSGHYVLKLEAVDNSYAETDLDKRHPSIYAQTINVTVS